MSLVFLGTCFGGSENADSSNSQKTNETEEKSKDDI